ncbi:hypothetical protein BVY02_02220 [bacterium J17]|nr:hypothetical protein BVY02_02220 [bacterium J17]
MGRLNLGGREMSNYERKLKNHYFDLKRKERQGRELPNSHGDLEKFIGELKQLMKDHTPPTEVRKAS